MEEFLQGIANDVKNIFDNDIETTNTSYVPSRDDTALTFPIGASKRGKLLETCVLFVDIRASTRISRNLKSDKAKLGKIYSAFVYAMTKIADEYGYVRNIIGDRVMVVFEPEDCYTNAINCAALMYTVATRIIRKHSGLDYFKVGIGIDYGEMLVLKTGITRKHEEKSEYKGLVWVGEPANIASKLTDLSNKEYSETMYKVTVEYSEFKRRTPSFADTIFRQTNDLAPYDSLFGLYEVKRTSTLDVNEAEFFRRISFGQTTTFDSKTVKKVEKTDNSLLTSAILISSRVYLGYNKSPNKEYLSKFYSKPYPKSPTSIYGGSIIINSINNIKI